MTFWELEELAATTTVRTLVWREWRVLYDSGRVRVLQPTGRIARA